MCGGFYCCIAYSASCTAPTEKLTPVAITMLVKRSISARNQSVLVMIGLTAPSFGLNVNKNMPTLITLTPNICQIWNRFGATFGKNYQGFILVPGECVNPAYYPDVHSKTVGHCLRFTIRVALQGRIYLQNSGRKKKKSTLWVNKKQSVMCLLYDNFVKTIPY